MKDKHNATNAIIVAIKLLNNIAIIDTIEHKELTIKNGFSMILQNFLHMTIISYLNKRITHDIPTM